MQIPRHQIPEIPSNRSGWGPGIFFLKAPQEILTQIAREPGFEEHRSRSSLFSASSVIGKGLDSVKKGKKYKKNYEKCQKLSTLEESYPLVVSC